MITFTLKQPRSILLKIHHWLIGVVVGKTPVIMNVHLKVHTKEECDKVLRAQHIRGGAFINVHVTGKEAHGITITAVADE